LSPDSSAKPAATASTPTLLKWPSDASLLENPPSPATENAWITASHPLSPAAHRQSPHASVSSMYVNHRPFAVSVMRGVRLDSFIGVGTSALNS
jgi:hypothetical protein